MSGQGPLTMQQLRSALAPTGIDGEIAEIATVAAVGLALLTYFIDRQAATMAVLAADLQAFTKDQIKSQRTRDIALIVLAAIGLLAVAPFVPPALEGLKLLQRSGGLRLLFLVVVVGYAALLAFACTILRRRGKRLNDKG